MRSICILTLCVAAAAAACGRWESLMPGESLARPFSRSLAFALPLQSRDMSLPGMSRGIRRHAACRGSRKTFGSTLLAGDCGGVHGQARMAMNSAAVSVESAQAASFEAAQSLGFALGQQMAARLQRGDSAAQEEKLALKALLSHSDGARGFYVTTLTAPELDSLFCEPLDPALLDAIRASPSPNAKLLTMNLAMSTASQLAHMSKGNTEFAEGSALTRTRTCVLISSFTSGSTFPALKQNLQDLLDAIATPANTSPDVLEYRAFLKRWGYDSEMLNAIETQVRSVLAL